MIGDKSAACRSGENEMRPGRPGRVTAGCHYSDDGRDAHDMNLSTGSCGMSIPTLRRFPYRQTWRVGKEVRGDGKNPSHSGTSAPRWHRPFRPARRAGPGSAASPRSGGGLRTTGWPASLPIEQLAYSMPWSGPPLAKRASTRFVTFGSSSKGGGMCGFSLASITTGPRHPQCFLLTNDPTP